MRSSVSVLVTLCSLLAFIAIFALVNSKTYQAFDEEIFAVVNSFSASPATAIFASVMSELGSDIAEGAVAVLIYFLSRTNRRLAVGILGAVLASDFAVFVLDSVYFRPRPFQVLNNVYIPLGKDTSSSFPSGHTTRAFAITATMGLIKGRYFASAAAVFAAIVALSRLLVGVHFPTDVIAGAFLGIPMGILAVSIADRLQIVRLVERVIPV